MREYYDKRAAEYDDWYLGRGLFEPRDREGWDVELEELFSVIGSLPPGRTLGLDQSARMLEGDWFAVVRA